MTSADKIIVVFKLIYTIFKYLCLFLLVFIISLLLGLLSERAARSWQDWLRRRLARESMMHQFPEALADSARMQAFHNRRRLQGPNEHKLHETDLSVVASWPFEDKQEWFRHRIQQLRPPATNGCINVRIPRSDVLSRSFDLVKNLKPEDMTKVWRVTFEGEPGLDAGGIFKEWMQLVAERVFDVNFALFQHSNVDNFTYQINPLSSVNELHLQYFYVIGRLLGKAVFESCLVPVHLTRSIYKHFLNVKVNLADVELLDQTMFKSLNFILENDITDLCIGNFAMVTEEFGIKSTIELKPDGSNIEVTNLNKAEYVELYVNWVTTSRISQQLDSLKMGFFESIPRSLLSIFACQELELLMCGVPVIDVAEWERFTLYSGDYSENHEVIKWFWEIVRTFTQEECAKLLQFCTGSSRVPAQGFSGLEGQSGTLRPFHITSVAPEVSFYPRAHTCFNRLDLPRYAEKAILEERIRYAIEVESVGFGLE